MGRWVGHVPNLAAFVFGASLAGLSAKQQVFVAAYIGEANRNATEAARIAGYAHPNKQGPALLVNLGVQAAIAEYLAEVKQRGIAFRQNRIDAANDRHKLMQQVIAERAADPNNADVPGGATGIVIKQLKHVTHTYEQDPDDPNSKPRRVSVEVWESSVDTALMKSMLDHEKQVAQEVGEWTEKSEVHNTGAVGLELVGIRVPLPPRDDDE